MQFEVEEKTVGDLINLYRADILKANPEYQRGVVWSDTQKRKLIDSVMRGYPLPLIYLHFTSKTVAGLKNEGYEVIDGQQRIHSLYEYAEGNFKLFDPVKDSQKARFPAFIRDQPCPWAGHDIHSLPETLKAQFLSTPLAVAKIGTDQANEVRDLFVRLQSGLPLNHQETRDAWPGEFTEFILRTGGKPELARYPGHEFFPKVMRMKPLGDRGKTRQLAAQMIMLIIKRRETGELADIGAGPLNDFYYENLGFSGSTADAKRFITILDKLLVLFQSRIGPKLHGHDAIHLALLIDSLLDDYAPEWSDRFPAAFEKFQANLAEAKRMRDDEPGPYWTRYGVWTRVNSDAATSISSRHRFYVEEMLKLLSPLKLKDPNRLYGELERSLLFYRQGGKCAGCDGAVTWSDSEVHHVEEHSKGGKTSLENGALVHKACHPKGAIATKAFAQSFKAKAMSLL